MDKLERVARAICAEKCAFMGEPPCYTVEGEWPNPNCQDPGCHAEAQAAIAAIEPMDKPRVKPLDWTKKGYAETPFGKYHVVMEDWSGQDDFWFVCFAGKPYGKCGEHGSEVAAKAAAQADYEARILAALEPVTVQEAARVLLGHTPKITAKPLAEMSEAMKIDAHPAILLRGLCAAIRAIAEGKDDDRN